MSLLEEALKYAKRGWHVFPTREKPSKPFLSKKGKTIVLPVKSPYIRNGFLDATTYEPQIIAWWNKWSEAGIGISCEPSNLTVIDIDTKLGSKGFENWMKLGISDEGALQSFTPSKGMHVVYSGLTNSYANVETNVDVRSIGAYFLVPPSYVYGENGEKKYYIAMNDWSENPVPLPNSAIEKLNLIQNRHTNENKNFDFKVNASHSELMRSAKRALRKLPSIYVNEYFRWVNVGMALYSLGEDGFCLWNEWSKQSEKYDGIESMRYKWNHFKVKNMTLGSLFFWAYGSKNKNTSDLETEHVK